MADIFLNLDLSGGHSSGRAEHGNSKHRRFLKKRKFLERRGFLKQKQVPQMMANRKPTQQPLNWNHTKQNKQRGSHGNIPQRTQKGNTNFFQQGAPSRTVTLGAASQSGTLHVGVALNHSRVATLTANNAPPTGHRPAHSSILNGHVPGTKDQSKPFLHLPSTSHLSEFASGIPSTSPVPSYKMLAIDCEMVGTGPKGSVSALARCSIVGYHGDVVYDKYIKPANPVTDYRTRWSGIRREHLFNAIPFAVAQKEILKILQGKTVIGHAIQNDYKALGYFHPKEMTRDTSKIPLLNRKAGFPEKEMASLKRLAKQLLHKDIQTGRGGHSSVEDAKTTMELYRVVEAEHERELALGLAH